MRSHVTLSLALTLFASAAAAAASPPGVNLNWDRCHGDGATQYRAFACNTNLGSERMVGGFELAADFPGCTGIEIQLDLGTIGGPSTPLPEWWRLFTPGSCRQTALTAALVEPAGSLACVDWAQGTAAGGIASYQIDALALNRVRVRMATATPFPMNLIAGQEYFLFQLILSHAKTVGSGACGGCLDPAVVFLSTCKLFAGTGPTLFLNRGANGDASQWVSWQDGFPTNVQLPCTPNPSDPHACLVQQTTFDVVTRATPTRTSTWGAVKALYR